MTGDGRLLDQLLVAPLGRAVALAQVDDVAVAVAEDLDLDMARALDELLDVERAVAERRLRLGRSRIERARDVGFARTMRMPRPPPPALALISTGKPWRRAKSPRVGRL